ncbi:hypothetical protein [Paenibacillus lentus]|uniref:Uncharacterized protein n=1 Tax=Paenibacillus lentus TaxID=1338368 RepID=A0A3S8RU06_9BACL|nr:hypothetical protein [Paenibacillus lentus]AZK46412.1 hypothetical protein EIM92_09690 [Paenibacillus lentus]
MRKVIAAVLSFALCIGIVNPTIISASPKEIEESVSLLSLEKKNFIFLEGTPGDKHLVYTYESNGEIYKVDENANLDFTRVNSNIYIKNSEGEFVKYATQNAIVNTKKSSFEVTTIENGQIDTEIQKLDIVAPNRFDFGYVKPMDSYGGEPVTPWRYGDWNNGSTKFERYTVTAVTALVFAIATAAAPGATIVLGTIGAIATTIVSDEIPLLYYKRRYAEKKSTVATTLIVGSKWETIFYSDSKRTNELERTTATKFLDGYKAD